MRSGDSIVQQLKSVFPPFVVEAPAAPHACEECHSISMHLNARSWLEVSREFLKENSGALPLLSPSAYRAYLPAWLREATQDPDGEVAAMVLINLQDDPPTELFTEEQAAAVVEVAEHVVASNLWGADDEGNKRSLSGVRRVWRRAEA